MPGAKDVAVPARSLRKASLNRSTWAPESPRHRTVEIGRLPHYDQATDDNGRRPGSSFVMPSPCRTDWGRPNIGFGLRQVRSRACGPVGFITLRVRLPRRRLRGGSRDSDDGRRLRAHRSAPRHAHRARAAMSPCSSASAVMSVFKGSGHGNPPGYFPPG
jgi:hypothetical protein